jgi:murein L,D-transpeptidase YafK
MVQGENMIPLGRIALAVGTLALAGCVASLAAAPPRNTASAAIGRADEVLVDKSDRQLQLLRKGEVIATFPVALGFAPEGHKTQQGDGRTPEGRYVLDWRNPKSRFYLSLHVSYPNAADRAQAAARGVSPGGDIFIHGTPWLATVAGWDWTLGCIAVSNADMDTIWASVADGTPIVIRP